MNEKDLSCLSYKELQALAVKYRVPGNIKKHLLIRVLQAVKNGDEHEVAKILGELHQARKKKRLKKLKRDKISVMSTPMHSPSYAMSEDCYYPQQQQQQQQPPYQWVGAVEEIASREEETMRVPDYEEFERFLLRRIQRDYQSYALNENGQAQVSTIVDLRMGAGSSALESIALDTNRTKGNNIVIDTNSNVRACPSEGEARTSEHTNGNNQGPVLLKKMLEAPAGANLGAIASPDKVPYRMWSSERYPNSNNLLDDSGTLTADSEIDNDDTWATGNNINGGSGYYCLVNSNKNSTPANQANVEDSRAFQEAQLSNNYLTDGTNNYHVVYPVSDVQANCQKWIAANSFGRDPSYTEQVTENSRGFNPIYYEETSGNSTITRPINLERKNQYNAANQNIIYEANQTILQGQISNEAHHYYQSNNGVTTAPVNPIDVYYSQQMAKRVGENTQEYFGQGSYGNAETVQNIYQTPPVHQDVSSAQFNDNAYNKENGSCIPSAENNGIQYNAGYYQQYHHDNSQPMGGFNYVDNSNQQQINQTQQQQQHQHQHQHQQQQHHHHHHRREQQQQQANGVQESDARKNNPEPQTLPPISNGVLNSFWPRWPMNGSLTSDGQLEPILNLHHCNYVDYTKIDQTSCVYCYAAPVVTQRIDSSNTFCTQKKRLVAECRQHVFSPNRLVYNDASTGMIMANITDVSPMENVYAPERFNSSTEAESETIVGSTASSENSINDVWIHDYSRYPVSSDNNGPHSVGLIIDENEEDLFAL